MSADLGFFGAVKGLFEYNRENFIFDRTLNQERVYQIQKMRVAQVKLYRDDLRDLFDLTIRKMDNYLIFNAFQLLFVGGLFYEGRLPHGSPAWLLWLWSMAVGSAYFFLSLSIWFAIHASITAQTFQVRLLTQWLRLPIPSAQDIHAVAGGVTDFENTRAQDMLRVPGVGTAKDAFKCVEKYPDVPRTLLESDLVENYTLFVEHFYLFRDLQKHWQGFDAYARIGMVVGTNMLMSAFSYMSLAYFLMSYKNVSGLIFPVILTAFQLVHTQTNLKDLSLSEKVIIYVLITTPPLLASIAGFQSVLANNTLYANYLSSVMFAMSGGWVVFLILLGSEDHGGLPNRFVTVGSIDVLGLEEDKTKFDALSKSSSHEDQDSLSSTGKLYREGSDTPVAVAVPPAPVVTRAEERRRSKVLVQTGSIVSDVSGSSLKNPTLSELRYIPDVGPVEHVVDDIPLASILEDVLASGNALRESDNDSVVAEGGTLQSRRSENAFASAAKARMLPWKTYRNAGAVLVCLWIFATAYSILASFTPRWGWPTTAPYGDGEESSSHRRLTQIYFDKADDFFIYKVDDKSDYGKVNILADHQEVKFSFDTFGVEFFRIDHNNVLHITFNDGEIRSFTLDNL